MSRVDCQGGQDRKHLPPEVLVRVGPLPTGELGEIGDQPDAVGGQGGQEPALKMLELLPLEIVDDARDGFELFARRHSVGGSLGVPRGDLLAQPRDPHLEELIQVAATDPDELQLLEERGAWVHGLMQHPPVELQPGELAIGEEHRIPEIDLGSQLLPRPTHVGHERRPRTALTWFTPPTTVFARRPSVVRPRTSTRVCSRTKSPTHPRRQTKNRPRGTPGPVGPRARR